MVRLVPQTLQSDGFHENRNTHEQLLDLVFADEELLGAEFDAIIAVEWAAPHRSRLTEAPAPSDIPADGDHAALEPRTAGPATPATDRRVGSATLTSAPDSDNRNTKGR